MTHLRTHQYHGVEWVAPDIAAVVFEIDNGKTVKRVMDSSLEILNAWYDLHYACLYGYNRDCKFELYGLENLYIEKYGMDCNFSGECISSEQFG
jgi:hypothetical protein